MHGLPSRIRMTRHCITAYRLCSRSTAQTPESTKPGGKLVTSPRWRLLETLYHEARALPPDERAAHVRARAGEDTALEREVAALLEREVSGDGLLDESAVAIAAQLMSASTAPVLTGQRLGAYEVQALIGTGGMGNVYRGHDRRLGRDVALKVLPAEWSTDPERLRRFANEARAAAALNHPHICTIYDVGAGETGDAPFIAMELLEGETLQERLARGPLTITQVITHGIHLADALNAAHTKNILHRDIKPANIFLGPTGVKVVDFGLAKTVVGDAAIQGTRSTALTAPGDTVGTVAYMSPEQLRGETLDGRSDVFSLGLVLYEMATGRPAFTGATASVISGGILHAQPIAPRQLRPELPSSLEQVILKTIEKDRDLRYTTAAEVRSDLNLLQREMSSPPASAPRDRARRQVPSRWIASVAVAVVLLAGFAVKSGWTRRPELSVIAGRGDGPHRLVVLPFDNISQRPEDQWLAGAFADSLTLGLRDAENLVLVDRARVVELSDRARPRADREALERMARTLAVRYYVHGTYQRAGEDIRVVARLFDVDGTIALQESLTDRFANLFSLQDGLALRFATALNESPAGRTPTRTSSLAAYQSVAEANDLYLAGSYREAIERLQRSVKQDDAYAEAWALLGKSYGRLASATTLDSSAGAEFHSQALAAARRAADLSPTLYEAQVSLALAYRNLEQFAPAREAAQHAIDLKPRLAEAYEVLATCYYSSPAYGCARPRNPEMAEAFFKKAIALDPGLRTAYGGLAAHTGWMMEPAESDPPGGALPVPAIWAIDVGLMNWPDDVALLRNRAAGLVYFRRPEEAAALMRQIAAMAGTSMHDGWVLAAIELMRGNPDAERQLAAAVARNPVTLREIDTARLYGVAGNPRMAALHLERAFRADSSCVSFVEQSPPFTQLRKHPVVKDVIDKNRRR
jgi:serine/threonine protein kinase/TolB-like protein